MASLLSTDLVLSPENTQEIITKVQNASAYMQLVPQTLLGPSGSVVHVVGRGTANWVGQAQKKPVNNPPMGSVVMSVAKLATIIVLSKELKDNVPAIEQALVTEGVNALAKAFDDTVNGFVTAPNANFAQLSAAADVTVTDKASFYAALGQVAANGVRPNGAAISSTLFYELVGQTYTQGADVFTIADGKINGVPYQIFESAEAIGFLGDFSRARWGIGTDGIQIMRSEEAAVTIDGVLVSLYENNLIGYRVEADYGFQIADINDYVQIGTAEVVEGA